MNNHVFISYVREDHAIVEKFCRKLQNAGIEVWLDREKIKPGQRWQTAIKDAIIEGTFFIVCFSDNYIKKKKSYAYEELTLAIEELRLRPEESNWFIPVRLSNCKIPNKSIGAGQYISNIQWVDLFEDWGKSVARIINVIKSANLEHTDLQNNRFALKERLYDQVFLKLYPPINSFQDHYIGYGINKNPPDFYSMKKIIYDSLHQNLPILSEELSVARVNIYDSIGLGDVPLADIQLLQIIEVLLIQMMEPTGGQNFVPRAIIDELPILKDKYKVWGILANMIWDTKKAAELLKIVIHFNSNAATETLSSEKFNKMIYEFNNGAWWNGFHRRREFFEKMSWEMFKIRL